MRSRGRRRAGDGVRCFEKALPHRIGRADTACPGWRATSRWLPATVATQAPWAGERRIIVGEHVVLGEQVGVVRPAGLPPVHAGAWGHGLPWRPDFHGVPGGRGGVDLRGRGIGLNSPRVKAAWQACRHCLGLTGEGG